MGENSKKSTQGLKESLKNVRKSLPDDVMAEIVYDRTGLIQDVIKTVKHNLIYGAILVIIVLFLILYNYRAGLLVAMVIPFSMLFAIMGMHELSIAASLLSLGAIDFWYYRRWVCCNDGSQFAEIKRKTRLIEKDFNKYRAPTMYHRIRQRRNSPDYLWCRNHNTRVCSNTNFRRN